MNDSAGDAVAIIHAEVTQSLRATARRPLIMGLSGAQGSGKTTIARALASRLNGEGFRAAAISLDDFYLGRAGRRALAARTHPLFVTRGPPGTHDVPLALSVFEQVLAGAATPAPSFDKLSDDRRCAGDWPVLPARLDVLIFEGWCLGARPEPEAALMEPLNMLERSFDANASWRRAVNTALSGDYQRFFSQIDRLVFLSAPSFKIVRAWRIQQERELAAAAQSRAGAMSDDEVAFFIQHFERVTRSMMNDLPGRADLTLQLDERRRVVAKSRARVDDPDGLGPQTAFR